MARLAPGTFYPTQPSAMPLPLPPTLGHSLGLRCTAEEVEAAATLAYLQEIGCDLAQGYHLARPMSAEDFLPWLAARQRSIL